jgi:hypothetical protein
MVSETLASVLRSGRDVFNAKFAAARREYQGIDDAEFAAFLANTVDPMVLAAAAVEPDRAAEVVMAAYELGLELAGKRLLRDGRVEAGWRALAVPAARAIAASPRRVLAAVGNALHQLAGARADEWLSEMARVAPSLPDVETLLRAGQVRAWMAGLAHYRVGALALLDGLPPEIAALVVGTSEPWSRVREKLGADPWFAPGRAFEPARSVGDFRGFGGLFQEPPRVAEHGGSFVVTSAGESWLLAADAFGATFHRADGAPTPSAKLPPQARLEGRTLRLGARTIALPDRGEVTSAAADASTLALTFALSHAVTLVALTAPA